MIDDVNFLGIFVVILSMDYCGFDILKTGFVTDVVFLVVLGCVLFYYNLGGVLIVIDIVCLFFFVVVDVVCRYLCDEGNYIIVYGVNVIFL